MNIPERTTNMIPNGLPTLSAGPHKVGDGKACVMEYVALLAGEKWTASPSCTHPALARMAQVVNDRLPDAERYRLVPLIGRLFGTGDERGDRKLSVQLAIWCAEPVLDLVRIEDRAICAQAIATASRWVAGEATEEECRTAFAAANTAAFAAFAATGAFAAAAAYAAYDAAAAAAFTAYAAYAADAAAYASADAAHAAAAASVTAGDLVALLTGFLDEYDRLVGRTAHRQIDNTELSELAERVASP
jgi:hypothetical protein